MDAKTLQQTAVAPATAKPISMHEGVPIWQDVCACEAEPYWLEAEAGTEPETNVVNDAACEDAPA